MGAALEASSRVLNTRAKKHQKYVPGFKAPPLPPGALRPPRPPVDCGPLVGLMALMALVALVALMALGRPPAPLWVWALVGLKGWRARR